MSGVNSVYLVGNVGKSDIKTTQNGFVCNFSVATKESWTDKEGQWKEETQWHSCVLFGKDPKYAPLKGDKVFVEGKLKTESYEKDGETKYTTKVHVKQLVSKASEPDAAAMKPSKFDEIPF